MKNIIFSVLSNLFLRILFFIFPINPNKKKATSPLAKDEKVKNDRVQVIIFDYDDTLFPTSSLQCGSCSLNELDELDIQCAEILRKCLEKAPVFVVTNSEHDWVKLSSSRYLPRTHSIILNNIDVLSARSLYESQYPNRPTVWKFNVFRSLVDQFVLSWTSVDEQPKGGMKKKRKEEKEFDMISFGDSEIERVALLDLQKMWNGKKSNRHNFYLGGLKRKVKMNVKNIKFINTPSCEQLRKQLKTVQDSLDFVFKSDSGLDLVLQINQTDGKSRSNTPPLSMSKQNTSSISSPSSPASSSSSSSVSHLTACEETSSVQTPSQPAFQSPSQPLSQLSSQSTSSVVSPSPISSVSANSKLSHNPSNPNSPSSFSMHSKIPPVISANTRHQSLQALLRLPFSMVSSVASSSAYTSGRGNAMPRSERYRPVSRLHTHTSARTHQPIPLPSNISRPLSYSINS